MNSNTIENLGIGKQNIVEQFLPDRKYIIKIIFGWILIWIGIVGSIYGVGVPILLDEASSNFTSAVLIFTYITLGVMIPILLIGILVTFPYYNSINYTLTTQDIIVNKGFLVKRTKIVPYRNITNFVMRRGIIDRIIGGDNFGTIQVETAGQGPQQSHPEQRLVGVLDVSAYTEKLRNILSKMKGQAGVISDSETSSALDEEILLTNILETLKEIKEKL